MLRTILSYLLAVVVGALLTLLLWPRKTVTVEIPPSESKVDSLAATKFEAWKGSVAKVFETSDEYAAYIDSLRRTNKTYVRVPVPVPGEARVDTIVVEAECNCVPEQPGKEFRAQLRHEFFYPEGDTSKFRMSAWYSQYDWPLHPSGSFKDIHVYIPPVVKTVEVPTPPAPFLLRALGKGLYFAAGVGVGYLLAR